MPTVRIELGKKRAGKHCPQSLVQRGERRRERRTEKRVLRGVAEYDPAHWPEPDYAHD
jgi:hypothetical protein